jgi:hypothetical protein
MSMRLPLTTATLIGALATLGCSQPVQQTAAMQAPAAAGVCALDNSVGNTCVERLSGKRVCHLYAGVLTNGKPYVFPHTLMVPRGSEGNRRVTLVWHLLDPGFVFTSADGPIELKTNAEFENGRPTGDVDGDPDETAPRPAQAERYRIRFKNQVQQTHNYTIAFRKGGSVTKCDPRIVSDSN